MPEGFVIYDPFQAQPALFEIAARLAPNAGNNFSRENIAEFANRWGTIEDVPTDEGGTVESAWKICLNDIHRVARRVEENGGKPLRSSEALNLKNLMRQLVAEAALKYDVVPCPGGFESAVVAVGLHSCLLIQAAEALLAGWKLRNCEHCGYPISPVENREDRLFCSNSCRIQAHKQRKKRAVKMRESGKTLREISAATGSDINTIKKWLKPKEK